MLPISLMPFLTSPPNPCQTQGKYLNSDPWALSLLVTLKCAVHPSRRSVVVRLHSLCQTHHARTRTCCCNSCGAACLGCCCVVVVVVDTGGGGCCILICCNCWCFCAYTCCCMCWSRSCAKLIWPGVLLMWFVPGGTCPTTTLGV